MNLRPRQVLYICLAFIFFGLVIGLGIYAKRTSPTYSTATKNKDTGQIIINDPNQKPERGGGSNTFIILGADKFLSAGMTQAQFGLTEQLLTAYVHDQLHGSYTQVSVLNSGFHSTGTSLTGKMRLGSSDTLLNLAVSYHDLVYVDVKISGPQGSGVNYTYDSGEQMATPHQF